MKNKLLIFIITLFFISCERDKELIIENTDIPLISKVLIGGEVYMEYSYNNANLVLEEKSKFHYSKHTYNDNNQLIKSDFYWDMRIASSSSSVLEEAMNRKDWVNPANTPKSFTHLLEYDGVKQLVRKSFIRLSGDNNDIMEHQYENDRIVRSTGYYNNSISHYTDYQYDENGNVIRQTRYTVSSGIPELSTTTDYEYDDMHNPYQSFRRLITPGIYTNPNNITKETYTLHFDVDPSTEKVQISEYIYLYNARGYPGKVSGETVYVYK